MADRDIDKVSTVELIKLGLPQEFKEHYNEMAIFVRGLSKTKFENICSLDPVNAKILNEYQVYFGYNLLAEVYGVEVFTNYEMVSSSFEDYLYSIHSAAKTIVWDRALRVFLPQLTSSEFFKEVFTKSSYTIEKASRAQTEKIIRDLLVEEYGFLSIENTFLRILGWVEKFRVSNYFFNILQDTLKTMKYDYYSSDDLILLKEKAQKAYLTKSDLNEIMSSDAWANDIMLRAVVANNSSTPYPILVELKKEFNGLVSTNIGYLRGCSSKIDSENIEDDTED